MAIPFYSGYQPLNYYPQQQQTQTPASGIIWVSGINEAQMYPVAPNNAVALWDQGGKTIFLKQADATGKPSMRIFDLSERVDSVPEPASADYVSRSELDKAIKEIKKDIEKMIKKGSADNDA